MSFKNPLSVFVLWHPNFADGQAIADSLYSTLCRDINNPLTRAIGIPVYYRCCNGLGINQPTPIDFNESEHTAIIALISDEFIIDDEYAKYLNTIFSECESSKDTRRIYPIKISASATQVSSQFTEINFIRTIQNGNVFEQIKGPLLHELCRLLMNMKKALDETSTSILAPPVRLFISHSKHDDSKNDAIDFRDYINSETQLKTFFDANDISYGVNFGEEIKKSAGDSALVVFQSDSYSTREWCRIEVITAKSAGCPIVVVNAIQNGEKRVFPYLGNYPSIRFKGQFQEIIDLTLEQVLFNLYNKKFLDSLTDLYGIKTNRILSSSPELFNFLQLKKDGLGDDEEVAVVIYPDPPLGSEELDVLNQLDDNFYFITPITLPSIA